jgi:7-keto-8-aminopelargonate synthetase-like enzyme
MTSGPLDFLTDSLAKLEADGLVMDWPTLEAPQEPHTVLDGRPVINMAANNYLGLATLRRGCGLGAQRLREFASS